VNIWRRIQRLSLGQLLRLGFIFLRRPFLIVPTLKATKRTFSVCDRLYGRAHHKSNKANAFRHALWNVLICQKTLKTTKNNVKSIKWAAKVTEMYEKVTKNDPLDKAMDLHNNQIGRFAFERNSDKNESEMVVFLQNLAENAQKVTNLNEIEQIEDQLVYLTD
jgi:hypothetical protein